MLLLSRRGLLVFLSVSLLFLLVTMPARIVGYWVAPTMHLTGFSGSLWRGEAVRLTIDVLGKADTPRYSELVSTPRVTVVTQS